MAKKINDTPRDPQSFLDGYKPVVPSFQAMQQKPEPSGETSAAVLESIPVSHTEPKPKAQAGSKEKEYERIFLSRIMAVKKINRVYISDDHYEKIQSVVSRLGRKYEGLNIGSFIWNILEEHFRTHGNALRNLIEENPQHNPFDDWK